MGYYTAVKMNELLQATWMTFINIMLSERSHTQNDADCMIPLMKIQKQAKNTYGTRGQDSGYFWGGGWTSGRGGAQGGSDF